MCPRSAEANSRIRDQRRRQLLDAALGAFVESGYAAARTEDIARRAGIARGLVHYYFADKESLFRAVCEEVAGRTVASAREALLSGDAPAPERLERFARGVCEDALRDSRVASFLARLHLEPVARSHAATWEAAHLEALERVIAEGSSEGSLRTCDPGIAAAAFWGALVANLSALGMALPGAARGARRRPRARPSTATVDEVVTCCLGTVLQPSRTPPVPAPGEEGDPA